MAIARARTDDSDVARYRTKVQIASCDGLLESRCGRYVECPHHCPEFYVAYSFASASSTGAETFVLGNFPLDKYTFRIITAERLKGDIRQYLKQHGFRFVQKLTRWGESLWINEAFEHEMDISVLDQFGFPLF